MKDVFTNSEPIFLANSSLTIFYISSFAVKHFLSHCTIVCFQNELRKWRESLLPSFSTLASFSLRADLEVLRHLPSSAFYPALSARNDKFLPPFALLPAAFSTFPTWKTVMLWRALWLLHSAKFLPGDYSYQSSATLSCTVSWWPHSLPQLFPTCSFQTALFPLFLKHLFTKFLFIAATFPWPLSIQKPKPLVRSQDQTHLQQFTTHLITAFNTTGSVPTSIIVCQPLLHPVSYRSKLPSSS